MYSAPAQTVAEPDALKRLSLADLMQVKVVTAVLAIPGQAVDKGALLVELGPIPSV